LRVDFFALNSLLNIFYFKGISKNAFFVNKERTFNSSFLFGDGGFFLYLRHSKRK